MCMLHNYPDICEQMSMIIFLLLKGSSVAVFILEKNIKSVGQDRIVYGVKK